jgi:3-oxoacyl-[acyl-carrier-protein] synthase II
MTNVNNQNQVVVTGLGMLTAHGLGVSANLEPFTTAQTRKTQEDLKVIGFNPAPHLTDRKVVKVVSHRDVLGLVAFEECVKKSGLSSKTINPDRTGLYVGAPPSSCIDHHNYNEGIEASVSADGKLNERAFGDHFRSASPTTLLTGLPNNVLCYGAKTLDARGPNSNYTTLESSAHMAIIGAIRSIRLDRLDCAIAGGYTAHSDKVFAAAMRQRGMSEGTPIAEGAAFATLETRENAVKRGAAVLCEILACGAASDATGPYHSNAQDPALTELMRQTMTAAGITPDLIEVVMTTGSGITCVENAESVSISQIWNASYEPVIASTATRWGNLMEAGGVADIGFLHTCYANKSIPESTAVGDLGRFATFDASRGHALVLRSTPWGEYSCVILKMEMP